MKIEIDNGAMYINDRFFCYAEAGNGRTDIEPGASEVRSEYSHHHGRVLPYADNHGWIGAAKECDIVVGRVRARDGIIPCAAHLGSLLNRLEQAEFDGSTTSLQVLG